MANPTPGCFLIVSISALFVKTVDISEGLELHDYFLTKFVFFREVHLYTTDAGFCG